LVRVEMDFDNSKDSSEGGCYLVGILAVKKSVSCVWIRFLVGMVKHELKFFA